MLAIEQESCIQCGACVRECNEECLEIVDGELKYNGTNCISCGHCLAVCPRDAIIIDGDGYNVEEVEEFSFVPPVSEMQVRKSIMMRRSVRTFNEFNVSKDYIDLIIEAAKYSPTGKNMQRNALKVFDDPEKVDELLVDLMEKIGEMGNAQKDKNPKMAEFFLKKYNEFKEEGIDGLFYGAPVVFMVFAPNDIDGTLCAATMGRMMEALGLGYCYILMAAHAMNEPDMRKKYNIPDDLHCVLSIAAGHYDSEYFCSVPRKDITLL